MVEGVTGILLTGGRSRRYGSNKALSSWRGRPLIEKPAGLLKSLFHRTIVITKEPALYRFLASDTVEVRGDLDSRSHPGVGVLTGIRAAGTDHVFVCACDMPLISPLLVERLCARAQDWEAVVPVSEGKLQPLCAVYSRSCREPLEKLLDEPEAALRDLFDRVRTLKLAADRDPSFEDIDTVEDHLNLEGAAHAC